jgi:uncharacterized protein YciI
MPYFMFRGYDRPGSAELRAATRPTHREYLYTKQPGCCVATAGPLVEDSGAPMVGTLLILDADDRIAAEAFLAGDPYAKVGLFERTELLRWDWGLGAPRKS